MREIQTAENKTLKLTNVVSRRIQPEEFNNMQIVLTQMHNFIKSNGAQPLGPLVQCIKPARRPQPSARKSIMMQQATQLIPRMEAGYSTGRCAPRAQLPVRPLRRPHEPERPRLPEAEHHGF